MDSKVVTMGKSGIVETMRELEPERTKKHLEEAYDEVTRALNGILNAYARDLPQGTHLRIRLSDCFSINLCWLVGKPGKYAPYPTIWVSSGRRLRARMHALRTSAYKMWRSQLDAVAGRMQSAGQALGQSSAVDAYLGSLGDSAKVD